MVCVGIDVAKDKHDCCILDSEGTTLVDCFTIPNNMDTSIPDSWMSAGIRSTPQGGAGYPRRDELVHPSKYGP